MRFERVIIRAHKFYRENRAETVDLVAKLLNMKVSVVRAVFSRPGYTLDPNPNTKGTIAFAESLRSTIKGKQDVRESVDTSVYEEALLTLAKENESDEYFRQQLRAYKSTN